MNALIILTASAFVYACVSVCVAAWMFAKGDVGEKFGMARKALLFAILAVAWPVLIVMLKCKAISFRHCK